MEVKYEKENNETNICYCIILINISIWYEFCKCGNTKRWDDKCVNNGRSWCKWICKVGEKLGKY